MRKKATDRWVPTLFGVVAFLAAYVVVFPQACDVEGVPSWERCTTLVGTPAFSLTDWGIDNTFDILVPLAVGLVVAGVARWWQGRNPAGRR